MCTRGVHVVVRGQLARVGSLLLPCGSWDRTQVVELYSEQCLPLTDLVWSLLKTGNKMANIHIYKTRKYQSTYSVCWASHNPES